MACRGSEPGLRQCAKKRWLAASPRLAFGHDAALGVAPLHGPVRGKGLGGGWHSFVQHGGGAQACTHACASQRCGRSHACVPRHLSVLMHSDTYAKGAHSGAYAGGEASRSQAHPDAHRPHRYAYAHTNTHAAGRARAGGQQQHRRGKHGKGSAVWHAAHCAPAPKCFNNGSLPRLSDKRLRSICLKIRAT